MDYDGLISQKKEAGNAEDDPERDLENDGARNPNKIIWVIVGKIHQVLTVLVGSI